MNRAEQRRRIEKMMVERFACLREILEILGKISLELIGFE